MYQNVKFDFGGVQNREKTSFPGPLSFAENGFLSHFSYCELINSSKMVQECVVKKKTKKMSERSVLREASLPKWRI